MPSEPSPGQSVLAGGPRPIAAVRRPGRALGAVRAAALVGGPLLLIGLLSWPLLFTDAGFTGSWVNHLWLMWDQSLSLRANGRPSLFLVSYHHAIFYPEFAFYGGTLKAIFALGSLLLGGAPVAAYVASYLLGFAACYGGWYWLARMAGVGRWWAHAPGIVFVTAAYYPALIYDRGDWPEFMAISTISLLGASALSVLRSERLRLGPACALVASGVLFVGSHPLTLLLGATVIVPTCLAAGALIPQARRLVRPRGMLRVTTLLLAAALVSAWWLLPALAYESHTLIAAADWRPTLEAAQALVSPGRIFTLSRATSGEYQGEFPLALPLLAMTWVLGSVLVFRRRGLRGPWGRLLLICLGLGALITLAMTHVGVLLALPRPYTMMQFSYRLETYVLLATSGAVLAGLALAARTRGHAARRWTWALTPALILGVIGAAHQTAAYKTYENRAQAVKPQLRPQSNEEGLLEYDDARLPRAQNEPVPELRFPVTAANEGRSSLRVRLPPGAVVDSNIGGGPEFVQVTGAKIVGLGPNDDDRLRIEPDPQGRAGPAPAHSAARGGEIVSVGPREGPPIVVGRALSAAALLLLASGFAALLARARVRGLRP